MLRYLVFFILIGTHLFYVTLIAAPPKTEREENDEFIKEVDYRIAHQQDLNSKYKNQHLIEYAITQGLPHILEKLLQHGAQTETLIKLDMTPLYCAVFLNKKSLAQLLLKFKADPDAKTTKGKNPLVRAAYVYNAQFVQLLLEHNADINKGEVHKKSEGILTPLISVVYTEFPTSTLPFKYKKADFYRKKTVGILLFHEADTTITYEHLTAEQWARKNKLLDIAETIKNYCPSKQRIFEIVKKYAKEVTEQEITEFKTLLTKVTCMITDKSNGNTPLHYCIAHTHQRLGELCMQALPDLLNVKNNLGLTPLDVAVINNHQFLRSYIEAAKSVKKIPLYDHSSKIKYANIIVNQIDSLSNKTFKELITEKCNEKMFYMLARVTSGEVKKLTNSETVYHFQMNHFDVTSLHQNLFGGLYPKKNTEVIELRHRINILNILYTKNNQEIKELRDPITQQPITEILYYYLQNIDQDSFEYLACDNDLKNNSPGKKIMRLNLKAYGNSADPKTIAARKKIQNNYKLVEHELTRE